MRTVLVALAILILPIAATAAPPNVVLILADDLGYSDLGCYGSEVQTPNLDRLAESGLRFSQFYNCARCCPTRAALLTGLYPHQAGVGHMLGNLRPPAYSSGLNERSVTIAQLLGDAGYRTYHVGKWHVGGVGGKDNRNHPLNRGFHRAYGTGGGGNFFAPRPLYLDREAVEPGDDYYVTNAFSEYAVKFLQEHGRDHRDQPFFLHLCYTAPHFPLHARPADIAKYRGRYLDGWDKLREARYAKLIRNKLILPSWKLSPRDPVAVAWDTLKPEDRDSWDLRMAVYAAMIDCLDQGVGRVMEAVRGLNAADNTLVLFLSDNGSSAEALDSWPSPARGHKPGSEVGTRDSHRCLEIGWSNAANTPFRENKMWTHEGGISTPLVMCWPQGISSRGEVTHQVGHVIDLMPTLLDLAGLKYPAQRDGQALTALAGKSLAPVLKGVPLGTRTLGWEHEGNRALRVGDWKLVAPFRGDWELYNMAQDRSELNNLASKYPEKLRELASQWQVWADGVGVVPWQELPPSNYKPSANYRKKSESVEGSESRASGG